MSCGCCVPTANQFLIPMAIALGAPISAKEFVAYSLIPGGCSVLTPFDARANVEPRAGSVLTPDPGTVSHCPDMTSLEHC